MLPVMIDMELTITSNKNLLLL